MASSCVTFVGEVTRKPSHREWQSHESCIPGAPVVTPRHVGWLESLLSAAASTVYKPMGIL